MKSAARGSAGVRGDGQVREPTHEGTQGRHIAPISFPAWPAAGSWQLWAAKAQGWRQRCLQVTHVCSHEVRTPTVPDRQLGFLQALFSQGLTFFLLLSLSALNAVGQKSPVDWHPLSPDSSPALLCPHTALHTACPTAKDTLTGVD